MELINLAGIALLALLIRKLVWCLRWLWCYYHGKETPGPSPFLPRRTGETFEERIRQARAKRGGFVMPFWRKSEDPWDMEPEKRRTWTAGGPAPGRRRGGVGRSQGRRRQRRSRRRLP